MTLREKLLLEIRLWRVEKANLNPSYFKTLSRKSKPLALWIEPLGNMVSVRELTGTDPGEILIYRNLGGQCRSDDASFVALLEYAIEQLKIDLIVVCGHTNSTGMHEVTTGAETTAGFTRWMDDLKGLQELHASQFSGLSARQQEQKLGELNVQRQVSNLCAMEAVQQAWERDRNLVVLGWYLDLQKGEVREVASRDRHNITRNITAAR